MIRIIIILIVILLLVYLLRGNANNIKKPENMGVKKEMKYCKFCKSFVTYDQPCVNKDYDHRELYQ